MATPQLSRHEILEAVAAMDRAISALREAGCSAAHDFNPAECSGARGALGYWRDHLMFVAERPVELKPAS